MFSSKSFRLFALLGIAVSMFLQVSAAQAQQPRAKMQARLTGVKALAKYEERGARRKFNFQLELGTPGQIGSVSAVAADGSVVSMGNFTVDALRRGTIDIDTTEGNMVADLNAGSVITLSINGRTFTGTLR